MFEIYETQYIFFKILNSIGLIRITKCSNDILHCSNQANKTKINCREWTETPFYKNSASIFANTELKKIQRHKNTIIKLSEVILDN